MKDEDYIKRLEKNYAMLMAAVENVVAANPTAREAALRNLILKYSQLTYLEMR